MKRSAATRLPSKAPRQPTPSREPLGSGTGDSGGARPPAWRIDTEPAGGLSQGPIISLSHLHAPREDLSTLAVDGALAEGYARRATEPGVEVFGVAGEDVNDAHVVLLFQQARVRRADLDQPEALSVIVSLSEVAEQLSLVVGHEAALDQSILTDLAHRIPRPRVVPRLREIRGARAIGHEKQARQTILVPAVEGVDELDHQPGYLARVTSFRQRRRVAGDDHLRGGRSSTAPGDPRPSSRHRFVGLRVVPRVLPSPASKREENKGQHRQDPPAHATPLPIPVLYRPAKHSHSTPGRRPALRGRPVFGVRRRSQKSLLPAES